MGDEKISQEFRLKSIDEIRNYFVKKIHQKWIGEWEAQKGLRFSKLH